jgi:hypothetical protein
VGSSDDVDTPAPDGAPHDVVELPGVEAEYLQTRQFQFPEMAAVGPLFTRGKQADTDWERVGPARGSVSLPADVDVRLRVDRDAAADRSWLTLLDPDDLFSLVLDGNSLDQTALQIVARLSGLRDLSLGDTPVGDREIRMLQPLTGLTSLCLAGSRISNLGVLYAKPLMALRSLDLGRTAVDNGGMVHLSAFTALEELVLADTNVGDGGLVHVAKLLSLEELTLTRTRITDVGLGYVARIATLRCLDIRGTNTTEAGRLKLPPGVHVLFDE